MSTVARIFVTGVDELVCGDRLGVGLSRGDPIEAGVDGNAVQPGGQRRLPFETLQPPPRAEKRLLRKIAGVFVVADEAVTDLIDGSPMAFDDDVKRFLVTFQAGRYQPGVVDRFERPGGPGLCLGFDHAHRPAHRRRQRRRPGANRGSVWHRRVFPSSD